MGFHSLAVLAVHVIVASAAECENVELLQSHHRLSAEVHEKPAGASEQKWKPLRALAKLLAEAKLHCYLHPSNLCSPRLKEYRKKVWPKIEAELGKNLTMFEPKGAKSLNGESRPFYIRTHLIGCGKTLTYLHVKQSPGRSVLTTLEKYSEPGSLNRGLMGDKRMCNLKLEDDNKAFVFVRNPLTRFVDAYEDMLAQEHVADLANSTRELRKPVTVGMSLLETAEKADSGASRARRYIENFLQGGDNNLTAAVLSQSEYLVPMNNCSLQVGFFIKGEKKVKDWETLLRRKDCSHVAQLPFLGEEEKAEGSDTEESLLETLGSTSSGSGMKEALLADNGAYMRAFCWLSMPDYLLLDYDLPEPCLETDMGMVLDMAYTWKMDPDQDEVAEEEKFDQTEQLQSSNPVVRIEHPVKILTDFVIYSAVPVWGKNNYIALLPDSSQSPEAYLKQGQRRTPHSNRLESYLLRNPIYCKGDWSNGHVRNKVETKGRALSCPWPADDKEKAVIEVKLEDAQGNALGTVLAKQALLGQHKVMACIRDVYDDSEQVQRRPFSRPFKQLVEWLEFHAMSGVEHFLFYTFKGSREPMTHVMKPYIEAGMATQIHFNYQPEEVQHRQGFLSNDCLFRAKSHAKWLMPTVDVDEYLYTSVKRLAGLEHPKYFHNLFEVLLANVNRTSDQVNAMRFKRRRFGRVSENQLEIEATIIDQGWRGLPKSVVNTELTYHVSVHDVDSVEGGSETLRVPDAMAWIRHYSDGPSHFGTGEVEEVVDSSFLDQAPKLEKALQERYHLKSKDQLAEFLSEMSIKHPTRPKHMEDPFR